MMMVIRTKGAASVRVFGLTRRGYLGGILILIQSCIITSVVLILLEYRTSEWRFLTSRGAFWSAGNKAEGR
jgi:hypothetical protein